MIRSFYYGKMSTMVCTTKGCRHKPLCLDCMVTHSKNQLANVCHQEILIHLVIRYLKPMPVLILIIIDEHLSFVRQSMPILQNHLIQTRKQEIRVIKTYCQLLHR
ncbi:unnamed protein product (macronuclear) [Paramecium tetraurelia]|uniref:Uncharacterized protein n=1 Tax=Paramecium tetraurelia TaxID=5888 RepID=A0DWE9_PARTE|nr:uncharacterized protein GSPATT00021008001 [Paramecium tetraurelia]CAK87366.1 unnamed protein product [Paramecium tetraurelia]|eukprot:XP_001454763.1 hypothetical protein (macronuclear) [Paramecium tetraurelia strain d4-2]